MVMTVPVMSAPWGPSRCDTIADTEDGLGSTPNGLRRVIVARLDDLQAGFIVDSVSEILSLKPGQLSAAPQLPGAATRVFDRVGYRGEDGRMILLVDPAALLEQAEAEMLKAMANEAGPPSL